MSSTIGKKIGFVITLSVCFISKSYGASYCFATNNRSSEFGLINGYQVPLPDNQAYSGCTPNGSGFNVTSSGIYLISYRAALKSAATASFAIIVNGVALPGSTDGTIDRPDPLNVNDDRGTPRSTYGANVVANLRKGSSVTLVINTQNPVKLLPDTGASMTIIKLQDKK